MAYQDERYATVVDREAELHNARINNMICISNRVDITLVKHYSEVLSTALLMGHTGKKALYVCNGIVTVDRILLIEVRVNVGAKSRYAYIVVIVLGILLKELGIKLIESVGRYYEIEEALVKARDRVVELLGCITVINHLGYVLLKAYAIERRRVVDVHEVKVGINTEGLSCLCTYSL